MERIFRKLLALPGRPAVLNFNAYSWKAWHANRDKSGRGSFYKPLSEDVHTMLAAYYGSIQVLSVRGALYHSWQDLLGSSKWSENKSKELKLWEDQIHPQVSTVPQDVRFRTHT